ncbi:hypothetical protein Ancab_017210 [Ancistrocladus abbreviatus]
MGRCSCLVPPKRLTKIEDTDRARSASRTSVDRHGKQSFDDNETGCADGSLGNARANDRISPTKRPAKNFSYRELCTATGIFHAANKIGEGGFGNVYKGRLETGEIVAIKQLNHEGPQGGQEFITEVLMLSLLDHPNLISLIGYCADGDERLLVYEYMPKGSLEDYLFDLAPSKSRPYMNDRSKCIQLADPSLQGRFPLHSFHHAIAIAQMCVHVQHTFRPLISDVLVALEYLATLPYNPEAGSSSNRSPD